MIYVRNRVMKSLRKHNLSTICYLKLTFCLVHTEQENVPYSVFPFLSRAAKEKICISLAFFVAKE